ncbi:MAG TPA: hypothetical protein VGD78_05240 [Chthoniobacterales bacterium]
MSFLFLAVLAAGSAQAQTFDLVDLTGSFAPNAPLSLYSSPGGMFSAEITVPSSLIHNSSGIFNFNGNVSHFNYSLNGGTPVAVGSPFAYTSSGPSSNFGATTLYTRGNGLGINTTTSTPFFVGSFDDGGSLTPGTYAMTGAVTTNTGDTASIASGTLTIQPVPEPLPLVLAGSGAALACAAGLILRRRRPTRQAA